MAALAFSVQADLINGGFSNASFAATNSTLSGGNIGAGWVQSAGFGITGGEIINTRADLNTTAANGFGQVLTAAQLGAGVIANAQFLLQGSFTASEFVVDQERLRVAVFGINDADGLFSINLTALGTASPSVTADSFVQLWNSTSNTTWNSLSNSIAINSTINLGNISGYQYYVVQVQANAVKLGADAAGEDIRFTTADIQAIPEPATVLLFGMGGFGAWMLRRNNLRKMKEEE